MDRKLDGELDSREIRSTDDVVVEEVARMAWRALRSDALPPDMTPSADALAAWYVGREIPAPAHAALERMYVGRSVDECCRLRVRFDRPAPVSGIVASARWVAMPLCSEYVTAMLYARLDREDLDLDIAHIGIESIHRDWLAIPEDARPEHPIAPLVRGWWQRPDHAATPARGMEIRDDDGASLADRALIEGFRRVVSDAIRSGAPRVFYFEEVERETDPETEARHQALIAREARDAPRTHAEARARGLEIRSAAPSIPIRPVSIEEYAVVLKLSPGDTDDEFVGKCPNCGKSGFLKVYRCGPGVALNCAGGCTEAGIRAAAAPLVERWRATQPVRDSQRPAPDVPAHEPRETTSPAPATDPDLDPLFVPTIRGSLPRFDRATEDDAALLAAGGPPPQGQLRLAFGGDFEVADSCPSWLLDMYSQATQSKVGDRRGLAWSFRIVVGALAYLAIPARDGRSHDQHHKVDNIIDWLELRRGRKWWPHRARDYPRLADALDELQSYRVTVAGVRYWVVSAYGIPAVYEKGAPCVLTARAPPSAARGMRIDWPRFRIEAAASAIRGRTYLSLMALLDRSARRGHPITRMLPPKHRGGDPRPNPLADRAPMLAERDIARFVGMADRRQRRFDARRAVTDFARGPDPIIDLEPVPGGWRVFGAGRKDSD